MRRLQIFLIAMLIFFGFVLSGEFYTEYVYNFDELSEIELGGNKENVPAMLKDITESAKKNNVMICGITDNVQSEFASEKIIYGNEDIKKYLEDEYYIIEGQQRALFSGKIDVKYYDFESITDKQMDSAVSKMHFYVAGDEFSTQNFCYKINEKYSASILQIGDAYMRFQLEKNVILIWAIISLMIIILSYYVLQVEKKENVIRITLGESAFAVFWKKALYEIALIVIFFEIFRAILGQFLYTNVEISTVRAVVYATAISAGFIQVTVLFFDISLVMSNAKISKEIVVMNLLLKIVASTACIILIVSEIGQLGNYFDYKKQEDFFEYYKDYEYVNMKDLDYMDEIDGDIYYEKFYRESFDKMNVTYFCDDTIGNNKVDIICANSNTLDYIKTKISNLDNIEFTEGVYIIHNKATVIDKKTKEEILSVGSELYDGENEMKLYDITLDEDIELTYLCFENELKSKSSKNPIIVLNNYATSKEFDLEDASGFLIFFDSCFYRGTDEEIASTLSQIGISNAVEVETINVYQSYLGKLLVLKRTAYIKIALIAALLFAMTLISRMFVQITFALDETEIAIKKTLGYSIFGRYKKLVTGIILANALGILLSISNSADISKAQILSYIITGVLLTSIDLLIAFIFINRQEKQGIPKILKGGCL